MILDTVENCGRILALPVWKPVIAFLNHLSPHMEETKYNIVGEDIYATVFSKTTRRPQESIIETHRKYVDLHAVITGSEMIAWFRPEFLRVKTAYDEAKDAEFYETDVKADCLMTMTPGNFALFFPADPHMPQLIAGSAAENVKKVVIKISTRLKLN